jgi:hypothetical protein
MRIWHIFACVQHVVCLTVVEEEKKDQIHNHNGGETNQYVSSKDIRDRQNASSISSPLRRSRQYAPPPVALGLGGGPRSLASGWFHIFFWVVFNVFFKLVRWWLHLEVRIRLSPPYLCFGDVSSANRARVEVCVLRISSDPVGFYVHSRLLCLLVWFQVKLFQSMVTIIVDGWCVSPLWS